MTIYLLACADKQSGGGVGKYALSEDGKLSLQKFYPCDRPMYAAKEKDDLFVLLRQPFTNHNGGCFSVDLDMEKATDIQSTQGIVPCHLCVVDNDCYVVNYLSGNLVNVGKKTVTHQGQGVNPVRQDMPHTHQAIFSLDKKYVLCCDLGVDALFCYDRELTLVSFAKTADGYGIRHAVFSKDGKYIYAISEMIPAIHIFSFNEGKVRFIKKYDVNCTQEKADGAAIRLSADGKTLYASLRVENALIAYKVDGEELTFLQKTDCGGVSPRDFNLIGKYLIVTNEKSNNVVVFSLNNGKIAEKAEEIFLPSPLCCVEG